MSDNNLILNPLTNKMIKKSGKLYKKLLKNGVFDTLLKVDEVKVEEDLELSDDMVKEKLLKFFEEILNKLDINFDSDLLNKTLNELYVKL
jgi:hypothetical protein